jgi:hypothetical protein
MDGLFSYGWEQRISPLDGDRTSKKLMLGFVYSHPNLRKRPPFTMAFREDGWEQRISPLDGDRTSKKLMLGFAYSHPNLRKRPPFTMAFREDGWEQRSRTSISKSRVCCPAIRRAPSTQALSYHICTGFDKHLSGINPSFRALRSHSGCVSGLSRAR